MKDLIDVEGVVTTAGCRAVAEAARPAASDAACVASARAAGAVIVGKANLHELALGVTGINEWAGTPVNPLDGRLVPGGSSSGSAVAVASGEADVALGTDTGGSVRIPSACCGTAGLKTTYGRIGLAGVRPLAPSLDTVGPMARDVAGLVTGMRLIEPGFVPASHQGRQRRAGRLRPAADPAIDAAIDAALAATGWEIVDVDLPEWEEATIAAGVILVAEAWESNGDLAEQSPEAIGADVLARLRSGRDVTGAERDAALDVARRWTDRVAALFDDVDLLATPTLTVFPPALDDGELLRMARCTLPVSLAGTPALAMAVPAAGRLPASLQLIGPPGGEEVLLAAGAHAERAVAERAVAERAVARLQSARGPHQSPDR